MEIIYSSDFIKSAKLIPKSVQKKLVILLGVLQKIHLIQNFTQSH